MWFADLAVGVAWLLLACWLGWVLAPALIRWWTAGATPRRRETPVVVGGGIAAALNLAHVAVLDNVEDQSGLSRLDQPILNWMVAHRSPDLTLFAKTVSVVGSAVTWAMVGMGVALWLSWRRRWLDAALFAIAAGGASLLFTGLKRILGRPRPPVGDHLVMETTYSLPSGHAMSSIVVIGMLVVLVLNRTATVVARTAVLLSATVAVCLIGWSRLYLGVHWGTDVLAGWLLGAAWLAVYITVLAALSPCPSTPASWLPRMAGR